MSAVPGQPCPRCGSRHRTWKAIAACHYRPTVTDFTGEGPWAFVHTYRHQSRHWPWYLRMQLYPTEAEARREASERVPCSGTCFHHAVQRVGEPLRTLVGSPRKRRRRRRR